MKLRTTVHNIGIIFGKEIRETLRDRRTLFITVLLPILLYPLLILGTSHAIVMQVGKMEETKVRLAISGQSAILEKIVASTGWFEILTDVGDVAEAVRTRKVDLGLAVPPRFDDSLAGNMSGPVPRLKLYYTRASEQSHLALGKLQMVAKRMLQEQARLNLDRVGQPVTLVQPFRIVVSNTASAKEAGAMELGRILAFLIIVMAVSFSLYPAIDMAAGEKERGTMETLLLSPASRHEIVLGKYLAIFTISMLGSLLNLTSMGITLGQFANLASSEWNQRQARSDDARHAAQQAATSGNEKVAPQAQADASADLFTVEQEESGATGEKRQTRLAFTISPFIIFMILVLLLPVTGLFAAVSLALSSFAKSYKEAQYYLSPLLVLILPLGMVSMVPGIALTPGKCLLPVTGVVLLYKELFLGQLVWQHILLTFGSTVVYASLALWWTTALFRRESMLFRESEDLRWEYWNKEAKRQELFTAAQACGIFLFVMVAYHWIGPTWARWNFWGGQIANQWLWLVLLPLLLSFMSRFDLVRAFHLRLPRRRHLLAALLFSGGGLVVAREISVWQRIVFPVSPEYFRLLEEMMRQVSMDVSPLVILFAIAVTPGICEEFFFRGLLLASLRRQLGDIKGAVTCALLFALMHMQFPNFSFYLVMGILLGLLVVKSGSLWPAVLAHMCNNGLAALAGTFWPDSALTKTLSDTNAHMPLAVIAIALVMIAAGWLLLGKRE